MALQWNILPTFPGNGNKPHPNGSSVSKYYHKWTVAVLLILCVTLLPLAVAVYFDYRGAKQYSEKEFVFLVDQHVSLGKKTLSLLFEERGQVVQFIAQDNSFDQLSNPDRLARIFATLNETIGGFIGLALVDATGVQVCSTGSYDSEDQEHGQSFWFQEVVRTGGFVSTITPGVSGERPSVTIAVKHELGDTSFFIVRAILNLDALNEHIPAGGEDYFVDSFLVNHQDVLQTPSLLYGKVSETLPLTLPPGIAKGRSQITEDHQGQAIVLGYTDIPGTPFLFFVIGNSEELHQSGVRIRWQRIVFFLGSCLLIFLIVSGLVTNLVQAIYRADWQRTMAIQDAVHIDKLASVGRMAAGVAHEINNPLAIIKEKAGFLGDLLAHRSNDETTVEKMQGLVESIDRAVLRCTVITHRVLDFSRPDTKTKQVVEPSAIIKEIIDFFEKDINRRGIRVRVHVDDNLPVFASERGKLQQICLNLISNAFDALDDNGHLDVTIAKKDPKQIQITFCDNGHGIAADDINRVFEPFFSTKIHTGGTGLGLFITCELVDELQGQIRVESTEGIGTCFFLTLPTGN